MRPIFKLTANNENITDLIQDRLLSLTVTDQAGIESDMLTINLDDRDHKIALPVHGAELECWIGYDHAPLDYMGLYTVDELELSAPPATMIIRAHAANMRASLKSKRHQSYGNLTMGDLVSAIASRHGLTPKINQALASIHHQNIIQQDESDLNLLTRLAQENDALISVKAGNLI
ncbi:MAG: hypothetical protein AB8B77_00420, partial [Alphaproteobacteria bacterium]